MAFRLEREKTNTTPYVLIDEERGYLRLEGKSYLENILAFFKEINEWLEEYLASDADSLTFDCEMEYFNSSTTKQFFNMLRVMDEASLKGVNVVVNWIVAKEDEMGIECGEDFQEEMESLEFNVVVKYE